MILFSLKIYCTCTFVLHDFSGLWKLLGAEQDDKFLIAQIFKNQSTRIGVYYRNSHTFQALYTIEEKLNLIQASVNSSNNVLGTLNIILS